MAQKRVNGMINSNGKPAAGDKFYSSIQSSNPYTVAVTFKEAFDASTTPIALASVSGNGKAGPAISLQTSNTSLVIQTDSSTAVPLYFSATTQGLGYYTKS